MTAKAGWADLQLISQLLHPYWSLVEDARFAMQIPVHVCKSAKEADSELTTS
jgi:hypothetical protein